jgi:hypothetical protein
MTRVLFGLGLLLPFRLAVRLDNGVILRVSRHVGFMVDKVALGQVFSEYFGFPCQSSFHQFLHNHHHLSSGAGTIGQ